MSSINIIVSGTDHLTLNQVAKEYKRILSYNGKKVTVTVEYNYGSIPPLIQNSQIREALKKADAATTPWYLSYPVGEPFRKRVDAASNSFKSFVDSSTTKVYTNRADYMRDNFDALNRTFGYTRGSIETAYRAGLIPRP